MQRGGKTEANYSRDMALLGSGGHWFILACGMVILVMLPLVLRWTHNASWLSFLNFTAITIIALLGLNIITGMAGQASMGHTAFMMVGGYCVGILTTAQGWPFWGSLAAGTLITGIIGLIVALPVLRLKGFYVVIVTLAFFFIAQFIIKITPVTGGLNGIFNIPSPQIGMWKVNSDLSWYYLLLVLTIICILASTNLSRSRLGRAFLAVRDNDIAASSLGINVSFTKLQAFFAGSLFAGLAGGLGASYISVVRLDQYTIWQSIWYIGMVFIGGAGSTAGTVIAVIVLRLIEQSLRVMSNSGWIPLSSYTTNYAMYTIYGIIIIFFISFKSNGLISLWRQFKLNYKKWPFGV